MVLHVRQREFSNFVGKVMCRRKMFDVGSMKKGAWQLKEKKFGDFSAGCPC